MARVIPIAPTKAPVAAPAATVITGPANASRVTLKPRAASGANAPGGAPSAAANAEAATGAAAASYFRNYTQMARRAPAWLWVLLRACALIAALGFAWVLIELPELGLLLFWGLAIPLLPALLVVAPGLWRQICPMAALNQLPRALKWGRALELPAGLKSRAFTIALALFIGAVALRRPWLNTDGPALGILLLAMVDGAIAGCCAMRPLHGVDYSDACEMKRLYVRQAFRRLGARTVISHAEPLFLPKEERDAAQLVAAALARDGVEIHLNCTVVKVRVEAGRKVVEMINDGNGFSKSL